MPGRQKIGLLLTSGFERPKVFSKRTNEDESESDSNVGKMPPSDSDAEEGQ